MGTRLMGTRLMSYFKFVFLITVVAALVLSGVAPASASSVTNLINDSVLVLREMSAQSDIGAMVEILKRAHGIAIFPSLIKVGFMVGARYGDGIVLRYDPDKGTWYGPSFVSIKGLSYGPQLGIQSTALVLVITNERGMEALKNSKITLGGDLSVAVGPVGRHAEIGTDAEFKSAIYSYSMSKGAFAGMSLEGAAIETDYSANESYWKTSLPSGEILNREASDPRIDPLIQELEALLDQSTTDGN